VEKPAKSSFLTPADPKRLFTDSIQITKLKSPAAMNPLPLASIGLLCDTKEARC